MTQTPAAAAIPAARRATTERFAGARRGDAATVTGSDRYLTFSLRGEIFALPILDVTEIIEYRNLTVVPMMPSFIRGVINLRGRVVPVLDLTARFGRGATEIARRTSIIIVEADRDRDDGGHHIGIMVDAVNKVMHLGNEDIEPPPVFGAGVHADFISGMAKFNGEFIIVLDVRRVLSVDELAQLEAVDAAPADPAQ